MKLTVLGSGTCAVTKRRACSSYFIQAGDMNILLDAGFGAMRQLSEAGLDYRTIDMVIISHFHLDHFSDLPPLLMALRYTPGFVRQKPLSIVGPPGLSALLQNLNTIYGDWLLRDDFPLHIIEIDNEKMSMGKYHIAARPAFHTDQSNMYRIESNDASLTYSGDTGPCDRLVELAKDTDLALFECSFPDHEPFDRHLTPTQAAQIAERAAAKKLVLTHFYPQMDDNDVESLCRQHFSGSVSIAEDLAVFSIT